MTHKIVQYSFAVFIVMLLGGFQANAFAFSTGNVKNVTLFNGTGRCPTGYNFYNPPADGPGTITCYRATVSCLNVADADVWFGVVDPPITHPKGTIVLHYGSGGSQTLNWGFPARFSSKGFQTVQVMWHGPNPNNPNWESAGPLPYSPSIKAAACRPATFFRYIYNTYAAPQANATCLLGWSAGASAIAYSLKDYNASQYIDKAILLAGPPMADLEQACAVPNYSPIQVWPAGQFGLAYTSAARVSPVSPFDRWFDALSGMRQGTCNGANNTTSAQDSTWKNMSIVDGIGGEGTFNYPHTALSIWSPGPDSNGGRPSDISAQGEIYARNFKYATQVAAGCTKNLSVNNISTVYSMAATQSDEGCCEVVEGQAVSG